MQLSAINDLKTASKVMQQHLSKFKTHKHNKPAITAHPLLRPITQIPKHQQNRITRAETI